MPTLPNNDRIPLVSVIIPTYNRSWGLKRAVAGVLAQTFTDFELVIVDDASPDDTPEVVKSFTDPRVRYFRQPRNVGVARNWGTGVELARGEFLALLMDDDWYEPEFLARRVVALKENPAAVFAFSGYRVVPEVGDGPTRVVEPRYAGPRTLTGRDLLLAALSRDVFVGATLYRTAAVRSVWAASEQAGDILDYAMNLALARAPGAAGDYLGGIDFCVSEHPGQVSVARLASIYPLAEQLHKGLLADPQLTPAERKLVRQELYSWYVQWGFYERRVGRPARAMNLAFRSLRLKPLASPGWKLAARMFWETIFGGVKVKGTGPGG